MAEPILSSRDLNRAMLARQLLLRRTQLPLRRALERVAGLQTQYAPSAYIRLWSMLEGFRIDDLTRALRGRRAVQATLMRSTIHVVSPDDYWRFAQGVGPSRNEWWARLNPGSSGEQMERVAAELRSELAGRVWHRKELDRLLRSHGGSVWTGVFVPLVRIPPSGTWDRRRADLFQLAEEWLGPSTADEAAGLEHLLLRYLGGFGPARLADAASWAGVPATRLQPVAERVGLRRFRDVDGKPLLDLPRAPLPDGGTAAPVRFLPTWDAALLVHARCSLILPEEYRPLIFHTKAPHSFPTFLVDGSVRGKWRMERSGDEAMLLIEPFEKLPRGVWDALKEEGEQLARFHEPDASSYRVRRAKGDGAPARA